MPIDRDSISVRGKKSVPIFFCRPVSGVLTLFMPPARFVRLCGVDMSASREWTTPPRLPIGAN